MKISLFRVRSASAAILSVMLAILVSVLIGGVVAVFLITQLWGSVPMWMVRAG
jgi:hypothetical protein